MNISHEEIINNYIKKLYKKRNTTKNHPPQIQISIPQMDIK
jgi:hypothetical protein